MTTTTQHMVKRILSSAMARCGGERAWSRLGQDARLDLCRAEAWLVVQARFDDAPVSVADVMSAMSAIYSMEDV